VAIWWVRRDLRLLDNPALIAALQHGRVVPIFVLDPALLRTRRTAPKRLAFMLSGLRCLDASLRARGSRLVVRSGDPVEVLARLVGKTGAVAISGMVTRMEGDRWIVLETAETTACAAH